MRKIIAILIVFLLPSLGWAYTELHYATATGRGLRNGTSLANAFGPDEFADRSNWDTDDDADNKIGPNDIVYFYDDDGNFAGDLDPPANKSGLRGKPITLMAYSGESPVISGGTHGMELQCAYFIIDGLRFTSMSNTGIFVNSDTYNADNNIIQNCTIDNSATGQGIYAGGRNGNDNLIVRNCEIYNNGVDHELDHGLYFDDVDGAIIEYNYVHNNASWGIHLRGGCDNNIIRYNLVVENGDEVVGNTDGGGIDVIYHSNKNSTNNEVYYNIVIGNTNGITVAGGGASGPTGNKIYGNTVYNSRTNGFDSWNCTSDIGDLYNNIFWGTQNGNDDVFVPGTITYTSNYNCIGPEASEFIYYRGNSYSTLQAYKNASSQDANSIKDNPLFTDADNDDLRLTTDSPCIGAGTTLGSSYEYALDPATTKADWPDSVLLKRQSNPWDIGGFVYSGGDIDPPDPPNGVRIEPQ